MNTMTRSLVATLCSAWLAACGSGGSSGTTAGVVPSQAQNLDRSCDLASFPSAEWTACEAANYAKSLEANLEQFAPEFLARLSAQSLANLQEWTARGLADPSWLSPLAGNTLVLPLCASWSLNCVGDPFRYAAAPGPDGASFYEQEAEVTPVQFYDRDCARLSGRVWLPRNAPVNARLPNIVITNGSVQAPETVYWWAAQALVRAGYAVLSYDPRGQGRSDQQTPNLQQGSNLGPSVFWEGQVDAIDFFRSTPAQPYPHNLSCAGTYPTPTTPFNPIWQRLDPARLGIAGHSLGAIGVSVVQGYGAPGADPWPGQLDASNPVQAAVAWDSLMTSDGGSLAPATNYPLPPAVTDALTQLIVMGGLPKFAPRVPSMSFNADYGFAPTPNLLPPDPENHKLAFAEWRTQGVPSYVLGFQGTTHFDFSLLPEFPATSWCPDISSGACRGGWGNPAIAHYTLAWFDRWLKRAGEVGYADADQRLVDDGGEQGAAKLSYRYRSARDYPDRSGKRQHCEDIRAGCE
jgi:hypothetical protein